MYFPIYDFKTVFPFVSLLTSVGSYFKFIILITYSNVP